MKRLFWGASLVMALTICAGLGMADDGANTGFYAEGQVSAAIPTADELETTAYFGGRLGYRLTDLIALEIQSGYAKFEEELGFVGVPVVPLLANVRLHPFSGEKFDPYLVGGLGVLFTDADVDEGKLIDATSELLGVDLEALGVSASTDIDIDNAFAGQIGVGALYHFTENLAAFLEVSFLLSNKPEFAGPVTVSAPGFSSTTQVSGEEDLNTVLIGGGVRFTF